MRTIATVGLLAQTAAAFVPQANVFAAGRTPVAAPRAAKETTVSMKEEPLGFGVIGCGRIGDVSGTLAARISSLLPLRHILYYSNCCSRCPCSTGICLPGTSSDKRNIN